MATQVTLNSGSVDSAGSLALKTNGTTTAVTIDTSQNVGIGTASPDFQFQVEKTAASTFVSVVSGTSNTAGILFGDTDSASIGRIEYANDVNSMQFQTNGSERMRIDSSGNVGIGTSSPSGRLDVESSSSVLYTNLTATAGGAASVLSLIGGSSSEQAICYNSSALRFGTATGKNAAGFTERMRIDSSGNLLVGTTSNSYSAKVQLVSSVTSTAFGVFTPGTGGTSGYILRAGDDSAYQIYIYTNGNIQNKNNSYGAISDVSLKENIVDATPKLNDLLKVKIRNYNLKSDELKVKQIGVIAQELEETFPAMIEEDADGIKGVKYSVFVPMLIKAIQEQQALITTLTDRITALEQA